MDADPHTSKHALEPVVCVTGAERWAGAAVQQGRAQQAAGGVHAHLIRSLLI